MIDFERLARWGIAVTVVFVLGWRLGILESLGFEWQVLLVPLVAIVLAVIALAINSVLDPTPGKVMWLAGIGLMIAPVVVDRVPWQAVLVGIGILGIAHYQRIREVYLS